MKTAIITLSEEGKRIARHLEKELPDCSVFIHSSVFNNEGMFIFDSIIELTGTIFHQYKRLIYIAPCGVVVRAISSLVRDKKTDPAVVFCDILARHVVSLLSGHEGGANNLAMDVANITGAEPVISTTTEARKNIIAGIGCRRGAKSEDIIEAIKIALVEAKLDISQIRLLASVDIKADEVGLLEASQQLQIPVRFVSSEEIRLSIKGFSHSDFVSRKVGLPAVAEPAALLSGRRTTLILPKKIINGLTIAFAKENSMFWE